MRVHKICIGGATVGADHDPVLQASYVRQCLAQGKRPVGFFIGAGCPMSIRVVDGSKDTPLIPDIAGITAQVTEEAQASKLKEPFDKILAHFVMDAKPSPNIEDLLSHIRSLRVVAGNDNIRGVSHQELADLDEFVCATIVRCVDKRLPASNTPYHRLAAWVGAAERTSPVEIFTTNYDLLMEEALESNRVPFFDGFVGAFTTFFDLQAIEGDRLPPRWARLWKIHGSLNWFEDENGVHRGNATGRRNLIYPSHLKYDESRRMPYLAMLDRLRAFLRQPAAVLLLCGYSFKDVHLNEIIVQGLQGNATAVAFAFLHGSIKGYTRAVNLAAHRANLNLVAEDEGVIGTKQSAWTCGKAATSCVDSIAVKWEPDLKDPSNKKNAKVKLGNFAILTEFTEDLIGERQRSEDILDGK